MKSLLFFLLLGTGVPAFATAPAAALIVRSSVTDAGLTLRLANLEQDRTVVELYDLASGQTLYTKVVRKHNGFSVNLTLDEIPAGRYAVSVTQGSTVRRQVFRKTEDGIRCSDWK